MLQHCHKSILALRLTKRISFEIKDQIYSPNVFSSFLFLWSWPNYNNGLLIKIIRCYWRLAPVPAMLLGSARSHQSLQVTQISVARRHSDTQARGDSAQSSCQLSSSEQWQVSRASQEQASAHPDVNHFQYRRVEWSDIDLVCLDLTGLTMIHRSIVMCVSIPGLGLCNAIQY